MKIPEVIEIYGHVFVLDKVKGLEDKYDCAGLLLKDEDVIEIDADKKGEELLKDLLHECMHGIFRTTGISQAIDDGTNEIISENVSQWLVNNFKMTFK